MQSDHSEAEETHREEEDPFEQEREERMKRSWGILKAHGIPLIEHLPMIEAEAEITVPSLDAIAGRAICLYLTAGRALNLPEKDFEALVNSYGAMEHFSPKEKDFIGASEPESQTVIQMSWRAEAAWVMFWALGYLPELAFPDRQCQVEAMSHVVFSHDAITLLASADRRTRRELLDEADLIYRYHWATRAAAHKQVEKAGRLDPGVVLERHHALNWLIGYEGQAWDDVTTDT